MMIKQKKLLVLMFLTLPVFSALAASSQNEEYANWSAKQAKEMALTMRHKGRVKAGMRWIHTERAVNYEVRATWFTPEVIRASARLEQIGNRLTDDVTKAFVTEAEAVGDTVFMIEIDPNEGSGVIPGNWQAFLQPKSLKQETSGAVAGINSPKLRDIKVLSGVDKRDYDYDVYWMVFPLLTPKGEPLFLSSDKEAELIVRINNKEGKIAFPIPESIRKRIISLVK
jgi:hypothetical protein